MILLQNLMSLLKKMYLEKSLIVKDFFHKGLT